MKCVRFSVRFVRRQLHDENGHRQERPVGLGEDLPSSFFVGKFFCNTAFLSVKSKSEARAASSVFLDAKCLLIVNFGRGGTTTPPYVVIWSFGQKYL